MLEQMFILVLIFDIKCLLLTKGDIGILVATHLAKCYSEKFCESISPELFYSVLDSPKVSLRNFIQPQVYVVAVVYVLLKTSKTVRFANW